MNQYSYETNKQLLQDLMQQVDISDLEELSQEANVARLQLIRIQRGLIRNLSVDAIARIAKALNVSIDSLVETFVEQSTENTKLQKTENRDALTACQQEYQKLQQEMLEQQEFLEAEFQQASLETIESWLLQWPTAVAAVHKNPQLPAERLLSLVKPIEQLLKQWDIKTIASVGEELFYDPQYHQLLKGTAEPGELVKVRYVGYKQEDKLLYKAKVSPVEISDEG
ncbi:helix-turn-helix domain-containing protein [Pleurocapsa sp. FMAR1]|uniref:helix-turn-helix domain-containing protein n=1 Tax=Pleurocapsa sp. FMAR1 TaxID=3040204 RepID=UPI0029C72BD3|nr:helix-turn-helix domain-containing protein [Pleurocapsa sp. FMAR1]